MKMKNNRNIEYLLTEWIEFKSLSLKDKTIKDYQWLIKSYLVPYFGHFYLVNINAHKINEFIQDLSKNGTGNRTIIYAYSVLRNFINYHNLIGKTKIRLDKRIYLPRLPQVEINCLNEFEVRKYLYHSRNSVYFPIYYLLIVTGMRISELLALSWKDIDFTQNRIFIKRQVKNLFKKDGQFSSLKTKYSIRQIPFSQRTTIVLREQRNIQKKEILEKEENHGNSDLVFTSSVGTIVTYSHLRREFKRILHVNNLPNIRLHDLYS